MKNKQIKIRFFTIADYIEEQQWLSYQQQGWKLVKTIAPCFFIFESSTPQNVIYQLEYRSHSAEADYLQMYQDYGWECCATCMNWYYFRKSQQQIQFDNDKEIF